MYEKKTKKDYKSIKERFQKNLIIDDGIKNTNYYCKKNIKIQKKQNK